ncbi:hypothetical protein QU38_00520, partial [Staphylococcus aureus]
MRRGSALDYRVLVAQAVRHALDGGILVRLAARGDRPVAVRMGRGAVEFHRAEYVAPAPPGAAHLAQQYGEELVGEVGDGHAPSAARP